jgi:hypothetical protein
MDKADLFVDNAEREDVEISRGVVTVRTLSRAEILLCTKLSDQGALAMERRQLSLAMVDPDMSEADVERWQAVPGSFQDIQKVVEAVNRMSGIGKAAQKEAYKSLPSESGAVVGVLPSEQAGDDGGAAAPGDVG